MRLLLCVANARNQEENMKMMSNSAVFETIEKMLEQEKNRTLSKALAVH